MLGKAKNLVKVRLHSSYALQFDELFWQKILISRRFSLKLHIWNLLGHPASIELWTPRQFSYLKRCWRQKNSGSESFTIAWHLMNCVWTKSLDVTTKAHKSIKIAVIFDVSRNPLRSVSTPDLKYFTNSGIFGAMLMDEVTNVLYFATVLKRVTALPEIKQKVAKIQNICDFIYQYGSKFSLWSISSLILWQTLKDLGWQQTSQ